MEGNYERKNTGYWTTPEKERADRSQTREYNRDRDWNRPEYSYLQPTQRQSEHNPQYSQSGETNPGNNQPLQNYYGQPPQWTPHPNYNQPQNRFGVGAATGYNQPRSLFDTYNEAQGNTEWRTDWRGPPNYTQSFENPQQRGHYGNESRRDSYGSDNQMKRKEYDNKDQKEQQNQNVKRRSTLDTATMVSPLEGLYQVEDDTPKGRGYGVQRFRYTRFDGNTRRRETHRKRSEEKREVPEESTDTNKASGSKSSKDENDWNKTTPISEGQQKTSSEGQQKTSSEGEESKERVQTWNKIDTIVGRNTGLHFGFYQEIPKGSNNDNNTGQREDEGWHALEERRDTNRASGYTSHSSPQADQRMVSPERARSWNRFDRNVNRRMGGNYGYYGNRSNRNTYDYNTRRNVREDWDSTEQFNNNYRSWNYSRGRSQYPRGRGLYRNNYNRNVTRTVEDWDAPDETTDANKTSSIIPDWDEPKETTTKDEGDKNESPKDDKDKPEEKLESTSKDNEDKKTGDEEVDDEEAQKQRERERNFAALMRYIDEDWGPPQWPSRTTEKTDNEDENSDSPKATSSEDSKEKGNSDPYDWIKNKNTGDKKTEMSRKSPDPIISKRSDSDEDSNADESPREEKKSKAEDENSLSSWEHCKSPQRRQDKNNDGDSSDSHEGNGNSNSNGGNSNVSNDSESQNTSSNTNDSNEDVSKSSREEETESTENLESSKERETSSDSNTVENERAEQLEATDLEVIATTSSSNVQNQTSGNNDEGGENGRDLSPGTNTRQSGHDIVSAFVVRLLEGGEGGLFKTQAHHLWALYNKYKLTTIRLKEITRRLMIYGWEHLILDSDEDEDNEDNEETTDTAEATVDKRWVGQDSDDDTTDDETIDDDISDDEDEEPSIGLPRLAFNRMIKPVTQKPKRSPMASMIRGPPTKNRTKPRKIFGKSMNYYGDSEDNSEEDTDIDTMDERQKKYENDYKTDLEKLRQDLRNSATNKKKMAENGENEPLFSLDPESVAREFEMAKTRVQKKDQGSDIEQKGEQTEPNTMTGPEYDSQDSDIELGSGQNDTKSKDETSARKKEEERRAKRRIGMHWDVCRRVVSSSDDTDTEDESQLNYVDGNDGSTTSINESGENNCGNRRKSWDKADPDKRDNKTTGSMKRYKHQPAMFSRYRVHFNGDVSKFRKLTNKRNNRKQQKKGRSVKKKSMCGEEKKIPVKVTGIEKKHAKGCSSLNYSLEKSQAEQSCKICSTTTTDITAHYKTAHPELEIFTPGPNTTEEAAAAVAQDTAEKVEEVGEISAESHAYSINLQDFFMQIAAHTGEYMAACLMEDDMTPAANEDISTQIMNENPSYDLNTFEDLVEAFPNTPGFEPLYGFLCSKCNFVQVFRKDVEDHIKKHHKGDENITIIKANLSEVPPDQSDDIESIGSTNEEEDITQAKPQGVDSELTTSTDTARVEENKVESESEKQEDSSTNPNNEKDKQVENDNETSSPIYPSSPDTLPLDTNGAYDDHMGSKVESEVKPTPCLTRVPRYLGILDWDSSPFLYNCFAKNCLFATIVYSDFEIHTHPMEGDCDSNDDQIVAEEDLMISDTVEHLTSQIEPRMADVEINNEGLLPENYNNEEEPPKQDSNKNSEQKDEKENSPRLDIFERFPECSDFPNDPLYTPKNPMESEFQGVNAPGGIEKQPENNCDLEVQSNADGAASHTSHDILDLPPVAGSILVEEKEIDVVSGIIDDDNDKNVMDRSNEIERNPEVQRPIRTSVIVSPRKKQEPQASTKEKRKLKKLSKKKKNKKVKTGLRGFELYKCGVFACRFSAYGQQALKNHMLVCAYIRQSKVFSCPHCHKITRYLDCFLAHLLQHGKKFYFCEICGFTSRLKTNVAMHVNLEHKALRTNSSLYKKAATNVRPSTSKTLDNPTSGFHQAPLPITNQEPSCSNQNFLNTLQFQPDFNQDPVDPYQSPSVPQIIPNTNQDPSVPPQFIPNTNQRPNEFSQNPLPNPEEFHDMNPCNTNQQSQTSVKTRKSRGNKAQTPEMEPRRPETTTEESSESYDELCCPICQEQFSVKKVTLYQYHLYEEVRHRRMMNILTKAKFSDNNSEREHSPDLETNKPILVTSEPDTTDIMFWVNKNIKRQLYQLQQIGQKKTQP